MFKKKLFSAVLAAALALSMAPATVFAAGENVITITDETELAEAIKNQEAGQTWQLEEGTYNLGEKQLALYKDVQPGTSGQGGWYFPIHEDGITIIGEGDVLITSDVKSPNGTWATQDFISVWADDVTIKNVDILSKEDANKAIEVMGANFTLKDSEIQKVDEWGSGSIIFNTPDIGTATLENVKLYSWISANYSQEGTLKTTDVVIDFTANEYAGYHNDTYGYGWCPGIFNNKSDNVVVDNENLQIVVDKKINLTKQVFNGNLQPDTTVSFAAPASEIAVDSMLDITTNNVTLDLNGWTLTAEKDFASTFENDSHLVNISGKGVTVKNGTLKATSENKHVVNVYQAKGTVLEDLTLDHSQAYKGAPLVVNNGDVTVKGQMGLVTGDKSWYGINVGGTDAKLTFAEGTSLSMTGKEGLLVLRAEDGGSVEGAENAGLDTDGNGNFVSHTHKFSDEWKSDENGHWKECTCGEQSDYSEHSYEWVVDKKATAAAAGSKHQECTVCGYALKAVEIPATGETTASDSETDGNKTSVPKTGDSSDYILWIALLAVSLAGAAGVAVSSRKRHVK